MRSGYLPATARAFSRASTAATDSASSRPARVSTARSSISAGTTSTGMPAASSNARRAALLEASSSGCAASHNGMVCAPRLAHQLPPAIGQECHHFGRGLLDGAACHVDDRPVVLAAQLARRCDLRRYRLPIDILIGVVLGTQTQQPVLADLHDP